MKTHMTLTQNRNSLKLKKAMGLIGIFIFTLLASVPINAQTDITVKGIVTDEFGQPLEANITLKGANVGTFSDKDGTFTFPKELKKNDVLIFTHLGFNTIERTIDEKSSFLEISMGTEIVEMAGALEVDKPYKSKRKK
ncbi:carboxypeptidase-like regulatory domain-containing protein [Formosa maritima]|uniref:Carboxypeptidase-like regulatory domain-containing protein n=1 Tax=Formosa maritima TaxID=2592046 RepID=A0A5D0G2X5_9FLAO|nr:carboxypeptidase-like regulatory domain-containing protein [Formosa maritima]TYA53094.1 hypothetical protein FVF61_10555 [Formosa maritima]